MTMTRYITVTSYPKGLPPAEKVRANRIVEHIPYEVSDEQLEMEAREIVREEVLEELVAEKLAELKSK